MFLKQGIICTFNHKWTFICQSYSIFDWIWFKKNTKSCITTIFTYLWKFLYTIFLDVEIHGLRVLLDSEGFLMPLSLLILFHPILFHSVCFKSQCKHYSVFVVHCWANSGGRREEGTFLLILIVLFSTLFSRTAYMVILVFLLPSSWYSLFLSCDSHVIFTWSFLFGNSSSIDLWGSHVEGTFFGALCP